MFRQLIYFLSLISLPLSSLIPIEYITKIPGKVAEKMVSMGEIWPQLGSLTGSLMVIFAICYQFFYPYAHIKFDEYGVGQLTRSDAYVNIENYLSVNSTRQAKLLRAVQFAKNSGIPLLGIDENEEVTDEFKGKKVWWSSRSSPRNQPLVSENPDRDERRYYKLTFHKHNLDFITNSYVPHVLKEGKAIELRQRERKLYSNNPKWDNNGTGKWIKLPFEHPATFETLALDPDMKGDLVNDLIKFSLRKEYYAKIGKAWKRGYLLYGPPGTGKSTTIAAMANLLKYDVYDLELTIVDDNLELKRLMVETTRKSIIVIEDIDCSLDFTGHRKKKEDDEKEDPNLKMVDKKGRRKSKLTLSGLLNSIDGLWSACGEERIIVFTTNYVDKLDEALIRRGRMDMHIELSYCCFEAFKVLAKNYLDIDSHHLFEKIRHLLADADMTPADVAEILMPKSNIRDVVLFEKVSQSLGEMDMNRADFVEKLEHLSDIKKVDVETCLNNLIEALEKKVRLKAEKEGEEKEQSARKDVEAEESSAKEVKESDFEDVKGNNKVVAKEENENGVAT